MANRRTGFRGQRRLALAWAVVKQDPLAFAALVWAALASGLDDRPFGFWHFGALAVAVVLAVNQTCLERALRTPPPPQGDNRP